MPNTEPIKPITIMGANASGKTELALALAKKLKGEIISADSKQVYKYLATGTAKPSGAWTQTGGNNTYMVDGVPYHLVDTLDPRSSYDAGSFAKDAKALIERITADGKTPIIAGGTGMYMQALWNGLDELPGADEELRKSLAGAAREKGKEALHSQLAAIDPKAAAMIPPGNVQRVIRAIEITKLAGRPASQLWSGRFFNALPIHLGKFVFIKWKKEVLLERIKTRVCSGFDSWAAETRTLLERGYPEDAPGLKSLGYPQMISFLANKSSRAETAHDIITLSLAYAKRQNTWFSRYKNAIKLELEPGPGSNPSALAEKLARS